MEILGLIVGILGFTLAIPATYVTYITYINPRVRVDHYLKRPNNWEEVTFDLNGNDSSWRYKSHPEFRIIQTGDQEEWDYDVTEKWMKYPLPDPSKVTEMIHVIASGTVIYAERFISLDGGRYFVPLPRVKYAEQKDNNQYFYTELQVNLARIIGRYYRMRSIDEFIRHNEIEVRQS